MEGPHQRSRKMVEDTQVDRLSDLPDPLIHHILSLMDTIYAVRTCVLSKKWRHHWTHIHSLSFNRDGSLRTMVDFARFVRHVLLHHKPSKLCKLRLGCRGSSSWRLTLLPLVFNYAQLRNIEELDTDVGVHSFPPGFFECPTLTTLKLPCLAAGLFLFAPLRTLHLGSVFLYSIDQNNHLFSGCLNLQNLCITRCKLVAESFNISALNLVKFTISYLYHDPLPNKKNRKLVISAPRLESFYFKGLYPLQLSVDECQRLEKVSIHMLPSTDCQKENDWGKECISDTLRTVEELSHAKFLSLSVKLSEEKLISYCHRR